MTNQEKGLIALTNMARGMVPTTLDFVILVYRPEGPICMSSTCSKRDAHTNTQALARAREAAKEFLTKEPDPSFNTNS